MEPRGAARNVAKIAPKALCNFKNVDTPAAAHWL
jgi:hypothetical protein